MLCSVLFAFGCLLSSLSEAPGIPEMQACMKGGAYRNTALLSQVLGSVRIVTPVSIWAIPKLHELVT